uniref:NADH-ubiquinone oxidoreductase chain 5 n=1 Tax=Ophiarachnella infernalis TaxID=2587522 RepID=A0A513X073_9ECHI|nr:NADH dehydrogenase subunit 5 [Ophiarachnella infernalis]
MIFSLLTLISLLSYALFFLFYNINKNSKNSSILFYVLSAACTTNLLSWWLNGCPSSQVSLSWYDSSLSVFNLSFCLDNTFILFLFVGVTVTWSIIEFSHYYMEGDPNKQNFFNSLILFLFFMLILTSSNSLFLLFVGWEGVGILSFILIGWWGTRSEANSSALQAIIYNRIGDIGMIIFLCCSILYFNSWNLNEILFFNYISPLPSIALFGLILAAMGKSAQFGLHPWLPSAMEGPTPVSALLHSSTMVVAGVFLLIRSYPLFLTSSWACSVIGLIGAITALFAASVAIFQFDIKKIVAYSTTSQLGLMVVAIGLNLPLLAFFHICTHAFFKSLLFLCSGSIIHSFNNEQDLRKLSNSINILPITTSCFTIGSLSLCGFPFLSGFFSKDLILEASQVSLSNQMTILLALLATLMTAIYSFRLINNINNLNSTSLPVLPTSEENVILLFPLLRLIIGSLIVGWLGVLFFFNPPTLVIPLFGKLLALILTIYGGAIIFSPLPISKTNNSISLALSSFLGNNWFFVLITHQSFYLSSFSTSVNGVLRSLDQGWTSRLGPTGTQVNILKLLYNAQKTFSGNISHYLLYFLLISLIIFLAS